MGGDSSTEKTIIAICCKLYDDNYDRVRSNKSGKECKMKKKLISLPIFAIALAVAFVFWAPKGTRADDNHHPGYKDSANSFSDDHHGARNRAGRAQDRRDKDRATRSPHVQSYGLQGDWRGQH